MRQMHSALMHFPGHCEYRYMSYSDSPSPTCGTPARCCRNPPPARAPPATPPRQRPPSQTPPLHHRRRMPLRPPPPPPPLRPPQPAPLPRVCLLRFGYVAVPRRVLRHVPRARAHTGGRPPPGSAPGRAPTCTTPAPRRLQPGGPGKSSSVWARQDDRPVYLVIAVRSRLA